MKDEKKIIGLLGGIGSGKSTVGEIFGQNGCKVINADSLAHHSLAKAEIKQQILSEFGEGIFDPDGNVDRKALAEIVFNDVQQLQKLNSIIHPDVMEKVEQEIAFAKSQHYAAIVLDIPLLMEVGWEKNCDILVFVESSLKKRLERAAKKGVFLQKQLKIREKCQISLDKKQKISDYIIINNSDLSSLKNQAEKILFEVL